MEREHHLTKRIIESIPPSNEDYRPDPNAKSALELAWHFISAEIRFLKGIAAGEFDYSGSRPDSVHNSAEMAEWYGKQFAEASESLKQLSGEQLAKTIDFRGMLQLPAVFYLQFAGNHSVHHRGQLSTYLRPMGGKVPSIYGESYDDAQARQARNQ